jgi:heterodisulfide reductase subunit B
MKYALYLGCTIPARSRNYELSARKVAETVDVKFVDIEEFVCCGFPIKASDLRAAEVMGAYNLALAERNNLDICVLCSSCASQLTEIAHELCEDGPKREEINKVLSNAGMEYGGGVRVKHFAHILLDEVGEEKIKEHLVRDLSDLRIAAHYGCHYVKPSEIYDGSDHVEDPKSIETLVALTGAKIVDYHGKKRCCGGPVLPVAEDVALSVAKEKLDDISKTDANAMCLVCPFCSVMFDDNQKSIESEYDTAYNLPVLYLTQVLGLAMGFDRKELGLNMNVVKTKKLLASYFE